MRNILIAAGVLTTACSLPKPTPYQPMQYSTGVDDVVSGGYSESPMGPGQFALVVKVNKHTDSATLLRYVHRRAGELCPTGYDFGSNMIEKDGYGRTTATVVVGCAAPTPTNVDLAQPEVESEPFFCAISSADPDLSSCAIGEQRCVAVRDEFYSDHPMGVCKAVEAVTCVKAVRVEDVTQQRWCTATVTGCTAREAALREDAAYRDVGACAARSGAE